MSQGSGSVSFDRAAEYYDRTRSNPASAQRRLTDVLARELRSRGRVLEVGVGTGRLALPLHEAGIAMVGADLSEPMLRRLVGKAGGRPPFPLAKGDATRLPFPAAAFGAAMACHVLHLIPDWRAALRELLRVVRPGGVILSDAGTSGRGWRQQLQDRFQLEAGVDRRFVGARDQREVDAAMADMGLDPHPLEAVVASARFRPEELIAGLEEGEYSWTWPIEPAVRRRAGRATRGWARRRFGRLDQPRAARWTIRFRRFDVAG